MHTMQEVVRLTDSLLLHASTTTELSKNILSNNPSLTRLSYKGIVNPFCKANGIQPVRYHKTDQKRFLQ